VRKKAFLAFVLVLTLALTFGFMAPGLEAESPAVGGETFEEIFSYIQSLHISSPDTGDLQQGAIKGLMESLNDPYSEYLLPEQLSSFNEALDGEYVGVGVQLQPDENYPRVLSTMEGSPAAAAGIRPGDLVIKVDGTDISNEPLGEIVQKIRGPEGARVDLTIRRVGASDMDFQLIRASISTPTVSGNMLDESTGYIRIATFGEPTDAEFRKILSELIRQGAANLILDLRDNPGGMLQSAVKITSSFIAPGQVVVSTVDRNGEQVEYRAEDFPIGRNLNLAVLVNQNSASAAEIVAGALQDHGAATIVGERTYGKGTVQAMIPLKAGGALKLTISRYHTPNDRVIDGTGLEPDIKVVSPNLVLPMARSCLSPKVKNTVYLKIGGQEADVNGFNVPGVQVIQQQGVVYLPLRFVFEALGYRVDWLAADNSVKVSKSGLEAIISPGSGTIGINRQNYPLAGPIKFEGSETYISLQDLKPFKVSIVFEEGKILIEK